MIINLYFIYLDYFNNMIIKFSSIKINFAIYVVYVNLIWSIEIFYVYKVYLYLIFVYM